MLPIQPGLRVAALRLLAAALLILATISPTVAADGPSCPTPEGFANPRMLAAMRRGVNLPGWDHPDASRPTRAQLEALRQKGFSHIRLPLDNARLAAEGDAYRDFMVDEIVLLLSLDYAISLDLHADETVGQLFARDPLEAERYLAGLWRGVAKRVWSFDTEKVAIELLNEPHTDPETWRRTAEALIAEIRRILPKSTIVVGPAGPQRHEMLAGMQPFGDTNVVYAVHYYDPFVFTHQGADWGGADDPVRYLKELPFPASASDPVMREKVADLKAAGHGAAAEALRQSLETPWNEAGMAASFDMMLDWSRKHSRPVIVNEFGVLSHVSPRRSRLDWLAAAREQAEERCIGWTHWDFQDGFGLMDPETGMPDAGIMQALVPDED